jgi:2-methylcitrate dehydratase PrpD
VNGTLSHTLELDDVHLQSATHGSAPVWAAVLAVGEWLQASPRDMTIAFALGYEVMARIGLPCGQRMISANHHPTGVLGYFGAAAAASRLLGLDAGKVAMAFGIAGGQAGACTQVRGTMSKPFFAGHSAHGGVLSALLAAEGFSSAPDVLEGSQGVLATHAAGVDPGRVLHELGDRWEVNQNAFKVHASCAMSHALVDGLIELRERHSLRPGDVESITLRLFPHCTEYLNRPTVATGLQGKFSAQYCAAVAVADGVAQEAQFTDERCADGGITGLMPLVHLVPDDRYALDQAQVTVQTRRGQTHAVEVLAVQGSPQKPLDDAALDAKFLNLARRALPSGRATELLQTLKRWPDARVDELVSMACPHPRSV